MAPKAAEPQGRKGGRKEPEQGRRARKDGFGKKSDKVCDYPKKDIEFRTLTGCSGSGSGSPRRVGHESCTG